MMAKSVSGNLSRMLTSVADLVCNSSEAGAHLAGAAKERTIQIEENSQAGAALSALDNIQRTAERLADHEAFRQANEAAYENAQAFLQKVAENRRNGKSSLG